MKLAQVALLLVASLAAVPVRAQAPGLKHYKDPLTDPETQRIIREASREPVRPPRWIRGALAGHACSERRVDERGRLLRDKRVFSDGTVEETEYKPAGTLFRIVLHGPKGVLEVARFCGAGCGSRAGAQIVANGWPTPWAHEALMTGERERGGGRPAAPRRASATAAPVHAASRSRATAPANTSTWDASGNLIGDSEGNQYQYDFDDRLTRVTKPDGSVTEHVYDADGNRVRTKVTPATGPPQVTDFLVDPSGRLSQVVAETDEAGQLKAHYVRGDDLVAVMRPLVPAPAGPADWQTRYVHADGVGSVRHLTDEAGEVTDTYAYTAFGERTAHLGTDPQPYAFAGEPWDPNSGFQYHRARWMDPKAGRFLGMDPWRGRSGEPASLHKYLYAGADPANRVDPSGRFFTMTDLSAAMASVTILSAIAVPKMAAALSVVSLNWFTVQGAIFWADTGLTVLGAGESVLDRLDRMAAVGMSTQLEYPAGAGPRGTLFGRTVGQNLSDTFEAIDDFDRESGSVVSIKTTVKVGTSGELIQIIGDWAAELDGWDHKVSGYTATGEWIEIDPAIDVKQRGLLVGIPHEPLPWNASWVNSQLRSISRTFNVAIRLVPVRGLRGQP